MSVSTGTPVSNSVVGGIPAFDAGLPYELHPAVEIRPEPFGALLYSFKSRRLSFLKDPLLVELVRTLRQHPTARDACQAIGITEPDRRSIFLRALATLTSTETIRERQVLSTEPSS